MSWITLQNGSPIYGPTDHPGTVQGLSGKIYQDIEALTKEEQLADGVHEFVAATGPDSYHEVLVRSYEVTDGMCTEVVTFAEIGLTEAVAIKVGRINIARDKAVAVGRQVVHDGHIYDGDEAAQGRINKALTVFGSGVPMPVDFAWTDADNTPHAFTLTDLQALAGGVAMTEWDIFKQATIAKMTARAASTVAEVQAVEYTP
ncbi:MAG: hypothetical protein DRP45_00980 [Candidatus Zixiibacteriota bacterium]|nr:MAG: hypothetical protein DRP45_00980 [candidate division Zixibacteria bacterium]